MQAEEANRGISQVLQRNWQARGRYLIELWRYCESRANEAITNRQKDRAIYDSSYCGISLFWCLFHLDVFNFSRKVKF